MSGGSRALKARGAQAMTFRPLASSSAPGSPSCYSASFSIRRHPSDGRGADAQAVRSLRGRADAGLTRSRLRARRDRRTAVAASSRRLLGVRSLGHRDVGLDGPAENDPDRARPVFVDSGRPGRARPGVSPAREWPPARSEPARDAASASVELRGGAGTRARRVATGYVSQVVSEVKQVIRVPQVRADSAPARAPISRWRLRTC